MEHEPDDIWTATVAACREALAGTDAQPTCIGITDQRETAVVWDRRTLHSPRPAIVWQDRRTTGICDRLRADGVEDRVTELTGLRLDPYFTGTKYAWLRRARAAAVGRRPGRCAGAGHRRLLRDRPADRRRGARHRPEQRQPHAAVRPRRRAPGPTSCATCSTSRASALPELVPSSGVVGTTDPDAFLGLELPVAGIAGDQQAALFGQACYSPGMSKCTYGTGSFVLTNTGTTPVRSDAGLLTTVAWDLGDGLVYALEGAIFVTGAAVQWLRDGLGLIDSAAEIEGLARTVPDSGDVVFVPALTGMGAPHWDPHARGAILGITRGTTRAHLARATLEAIAFEVRDVVDIMVSEAGLRCRSSPPTAARAPTTCSCSCRPTSSACRCAVRWSPRRRRWARRSSPASAPASGARPTSWRRRGRSTAGSSPSTGSGTTAGTTAGATPSAAPAGWTTVLRDPLSRAAKSR